MCSVTSVTSDSATLWTVARQAPLSLGFFRQEHWSGLPFPSPGAFSAQALNPHLLHLLLWQVGFFTTEPPGKPPVKQYNWLFQYQVLRMKSI